MGSWGVLWSRDFRNRLLTLSFPPLAPTFRFFLLCLVSFVTGWLAGWLSVSDFRTPGTGLYDNLAKYELPRPEAIFSIDYFKERPQAFCTLAKEVGACAEEGFAS